jgi:hypothetical protein
MAKSTNPAHEAGASASAVIIESVADILERDLNAVIQEWLIRVDKEPDLTAIPLSFEDRTGHLPQLLRDVIVRLRLDAQTLRSAQGTRSTIDHKRPDFRFSLVGLLSVARVEHHITPVNIG